VGPFGIIFISQFRTSRFLPMATFWVLAAAMTVAALAFILVPLLRPRPRGGPSVEEANLDVLRGQRREIEADVANGTLPADAREEALAELLARARADLVPAAPLAPAGKRPWAAAAVAAVALPAVAFGIYLAVGTPEAADPAKVGHAGAQLTDAQVVAMVENLARKVRERPDDVRGWTLLARSLAAMGRFDEAVPAYEHLAKLTPDDPQVLADYADALGMQQGRSLAGKPYELVKRALAIDPQHGKALALAGTAALDAGAYGDAVGYWRTLAGEMPAGSEDRGRVESMIDEVRERAAAAGKPIPGANANVARAGGSSSVARTADARAVPAGASVTGSVSVAPGLADKVDRSATLFIFARAASGPRMPLAVIRGSAGELPRAFTLDDSLAMAPTMKISGAEAVRIEARISRSGNAQPQSGDLEGASAIVKPGARDVRVVLDKVVP
jgi:cytochrome c-type biogenesis protein CcmH